MSNLLDKASILLTPTAYSDGTLHSVKPIQTFGSELVTNGDFATDSNWNVHSGWSISDGKANIDTDNGTLNFTQSHVLVVGKKYRLSLIANVTVGSIKFESGEGDNLVFTSNIDSHIFVADSTLVVFRRQLEPTRGYIDNVSIEEVTDGDFDFTRATTATRVNSSGLIESVAGGLPRIDFLGGTGQILLEPASTNLALNSNDLTNSTWSKFNATASTSTIVNPEGTSGASLYTCGNFTGANQYFRINPNTTYTSDASFTYSMFVKYNTFQFCRLTYVKFFPQVHFSAVFDIVNGTVTATDTDGTPQNTSSKIENFGNGWFRISISAAISSSSGNNMNFEFNKSPSGTPTFDIFGRTEQTTTTNDKVYVYGAQLEQQSFATSYIPTSGSPVSRAADQANNSGDASLINSTEGVLYAEIAAFANDGTTRAFSLSSGSSTNRVFISYSVTNNRVSCFGSTGGATQFSMGADITDVTDFIKVALKYKLNDIALFINGSEVNTDTSATLPSADTFTSLQFDSGGGASEFFGKVKSIAVFKEALTDSELIALTS